MKKHLLRRVLSFVLIFTLISGLAGCGNPNKETGKGDMISPPTGPEDALRVVCPKCGEEKCDVFTDGDISGYKCRGCFTRFGFFEPTTVEVMKDGRGFYLVKNGDLYNVMFTTYYFKDGNHLIAPGFRSCDMEREDSDDGILVFNSTKGWAVLSIDSTENGVIKGNGQIEFDRIKLELGDTTFASVSSEPLPEGLNLFGEQGVSYFSNEMRPTEHFMICEEGNLKLDLSSFTENGSFANLYIQNPAVIEGILEEEDSPVDGSRMLLICGHDRDIFITIAIRAELMAHGEEGDIIVLKVSYNAIDNISGARFTLDDRSMLYTVETK